MCCVDNGQSYVKYKIVNRSDREQSRSQFHRQPCGRWCVRNDRCGRGLGGLWLLGGRGHRRRRRQRVGRDASRVAVPTVPVGHDAALGRLAGALTGLPRALAAPATGPAAAAAAAAVAARAAATHRYDRVRPFRDRVQVRR